MQLEKLVINVCGVTGRHLDVLMRNAVPQTASLRLQPTVYADAMEQLTEAIPAKAGCQIQTIQRKRTTQRNQATLQLAVGLSMVPLQRTT